MERDERFHQPPKRREWPLRRRVAFRRCGVGVRLQEHAIDTRANIGFRYHQTGSPFEYELVRFLYTKKRRLDIKR